jgi:hypothetical protein
MTPNEQLLAIEPGKQALHEAMLEGIRQGRQGWREVSLFSMLRRLGEKLGKFCAAPTLPNAAKLAVYAFMTVEAIQASKGSSGTGP